MNRLLRRLVRLLPGNEPKNGQLPKLAVKPTPRRQQLLRLRAVPKLLRQRPLGAVGVVAAVVAKERQPVARPVRRSRPPKIPPWLLRRLLPPERALEPVAAVAVRGELPRHPPPLRLLPAANQRDAALLLGKEAAALRKRWLLLNLPLLALLGRAVSFLRQFLLPRSRWWQFPRRCRLQ